MDASNYEDETRALLGERTGETPVGLLMHSHARPCVLCLLGYSLWRQAAGAAGCCCRCRASAPPCRTVWTPPQVPDPPLQPLQPTRPAGMSSYVLFTLDKLVQKVVKQVQLVLQEEQSHRLVELWRYEAARGVSVSTSCCLRLCAAAQPGASRSFLCIAATCSAVHAPVATCHRQCRVPPPIEGNHTSLSPPPALLCHPLIMWCRWWMLCTTPTRTCCCRATPASAGSACPTAS